ncbi:hypothetical protein FT663_04227 [Candidozyma haemuli var. vulneris]|uniref:Ribosome maturation protein SDO1/SBDS N-terminal domain-containing protein n=1 Tax=Candidozyma haemuli TaxID=45357 RepID=A0A2V1AZI4_9ASCO|nr:hypothetical protein CXQ85_002805 [[Candida] haemuloni]KAF3987947.1 hypothetical protein FT663_04227 [[Candida] haemuloni var. vulneris]KAF3991020.1 hypothetical protein FT662_01956 [[Candida] haemuloni var. vulneris]PVH23079.1 hypothetical protein CXQ85_002805 [[Candida] haemuloni]
MSPQPHKIFYKGEEHDFVIFTENPDLIQKYKKGDTTIPLVDLVSVWKVFINRQGGADGILDEASRNELENEFGPKTKVDDAIKKILDEGQDKSQVGTFDEQKPV